MLGTQSPSESYNYKRGAKLQAIDATRIRLLELRKSATPERIEKIDGELIRLDAKEQRAMTIPDTKEFSHQQYGVS